MADDIVKQLRRMAMRVRDSHDRNTLTHAADEIVRLRAEVAAWRKDAHGG